MSRVSVYLDYAASAPLRPEATKAVQRAQAVFGNASSTHGFGQSALGMVDVARQQMAEILNCQPDEIVFTSGGTESDNLGVKGVAMTHDKGHIVTTSIEHKAVLESCHALEAWGYSVSYVNPDKHGVVTTQAIMNAMRPNTFLVSVMYVNNETGMIQPIEQIGQAIAKLNREESRNILFHTDAVQAGSLLPLDTKHLNVDMMTLSSHKVGGPKGVGCLYIKTGVRLAPIIDGGGQERGVRSGTLNTPGIVGFSAALATCQKNKERERERLGKLQARLTEKITRLDGVTFNGEDRHRLPSILNISVAGFTSDQLVIGLDLAGLAVSAASACSSGSIDPSYVLAAMSASDEQARSSLRISIGYKTRQGDLDRFALALKKLIESK